MSKKARYRAVEVDLKRPHIPGHSGADENGLKPRWIATLDAYANITINGLLLTARGSYVDTVRYLSTTYNENERMQPPEYSPSTPKWRTDTI
jgi:hypothetical protein